MSKFCVNVCQFTLGQICGGETNKTAESDCSDECIKYEVKKKLKTDSGKVIADFLATTNGCSRYVNTPKKKLPSKQASR